MNHDGVYTPGSGISKGTADQTFLNDLLAAAGQNPIGVVLAYVYYGAVTTLGGAYYQGDMPATTAPAPRDQYIDQTIEAFTVDYTASGFLETFGAGTSSDVWYDGSAFGDYVCDEYYQIGGGGGRGGNEIIWLPEGREAEPLAC